MAAFATRRPRAEGIHGSILTQETPDSQSSVIRIRVYGDYMRLGVHGYSAKGFLPSRHRQVSAGGGKIIRTPSDRVHPPLV